MPGGNLPFLPPTLTAACLLLLPRLSKLSIPVWVIRFEEEEEGGSEAAAEIGGGKRASKSTAKVSPKAFSPLKPFSPCPPPPTQRLDCLPKSLHVHPTSARPSETTLQRKRSSLSLPWEERRVFRPDDHKRALIPPTQKERPFSSPQRGENGISIRNSPTKPDPDPDPAPDLLLKKRFLVSAGRRREPLFQCGKGRRLKMIFLLGIFKAEIKGLWVSGARMI